MITGYKTYIASLLPIVMGVIELTDWNHFIQNPKAGLIALGSGILMAVMRSITTTTKPPVA